MKTKHYIDFMIERAFNAAFEEVEKQVIKLLKSKKNAGVGFIMGMGTYFFIDKNDDIIDDNRAWMKPVQDIFQEYDDTLKISGVATRWDLDQTTGKVIRTDETRKK